MTEPTDPTAGERACDWCNKPASEATDLTTMWWADYECCSMECVMRAEAEVNRPATPAGEREAFVYTVDLATGEFGTAPAEPDAGDVEALTEAIGLSLYESLMEASADQWRRWEYLTDAAKETYRDEAARIIAVAVTPTLTARLDAARAEALTEAAAEWDGAERVRLETVGKWLRARAARIVEESRMTEPHHTTAQPDAGDVEAHRPECWCNGTGWRVELNAPCNLPQPDGFAPPATPNAGDVEALAEDVFGAMEALGIEDATMTDARMIVDGFAHRLEARLDAARAEERERIAQTIDGERVVWTHADVTNARRDVFNLCARIARESR